MQDRNGLTSLMWAAGSGNVRQVELLIQYGADVNARDAVSGRG